MITTVTLNPAVDLVVACPDWKKGEVNAYTDPVYAPGGKGINVSLALKELGVESRALGLCGGFTGRQVLESLRERGIPADFVELRGGNTRINIKISSQEETELNGKGPEVSPREAEAFIKKIAGVKGYLVLAGSLPGSLPEDFYARVLSAAPEGVKAVVDTTGCRLLECLRYKPFLIKPNHRELADLFHVRIETPQEAAEYGARLQRMGARNVLVSMGSLGAVLIAEETEFLPALRGETVSPCGAGDSMVAGFLYGLLREGSMREALRWGTAAGAATACSKGIAPGALIRQKYEELSRR